MRPTRFALFVASVLLAFTGLVASTAVSTDADATMTAAATSPAVNFDSEALYEAVHDARVTAAQREYRQAWHAAEQQIHDQAVAEFTWNAQLAENARAEWYAGVERARAEAARLEAIREAEEAAAAEAAAQATYTEPTYTAPAETVYGSGSCGGSLPPCSVMECESGGSLTIVNPSSGAAGKWQVLPSTWNGYGGYASAADAPESVQDAFAAQLYAGGAGAGHWVCS